MRHLKRLLLGGTLVLATTATAEEFVVVVHASHAGNHISRQALAAIYTGSALHWGDETEIQPVDQSTQAPVRHAFTSRVLGMTLGEVQLLWRQQMSRRRVSPPPTKGSDEDVLVFVAEHVGAVGYVSADAVVPDGVRVVTLVD